MKWLEDFLDKGWYLIKSTFQRSPLYGIILIIIILAILAWIDTKLEE